jgi:4-amino-4-deoxy-L-arabinose transferase-like glycosyltransferase
VGTLALYLVLVLIYNSATPIFEASDEFRHYLTIRYIALHHQLPVLQPSDDPFAPWQEAGQPPLYYLLGTALTGWIDSSDIAQNTDFNPHAQAGIPSTSPDSKNLFVPSPAEDFPYHGVSLAAHLVRLLSALMGAATVYLTYRLARAIAPGLPPVALLAAAVVAFNPQFLFVSASVDNDNLITLAATAVLLLLAQVLVKGLTGRRLWLLSGALGAAVLAKLSGLGLPPLAAVVVGAQGLKLSGWRGAVRLVLALASVPVAVSAWWFLRNQLIYGEPTGLRAWAELVHTRAPDALQVIREVPGLFMSYWGVFGAFDIQADAWVYFVYLAFCLAGLAGLVFLAARPRSAPRGAPLSVVYDRFGSAAAPAAAGNDRRQGISRSGPGGSGGHEGISRSGLLLLVAWLAILVVALARWTTVASASTGRLLFPGIAAAAILVALGVLAPLREDWRRPAALGAGGALLALAAYLPFQYIFPAYERPPILTAPAGQPSTATTVDYGGKLELLGYDLPATTAKPGDDVTLRLYWRVLGNMDRNYSVTVQLLTGEGPAGQYDSFPGQGRIATRRLQPGQYFTDTYRVEVKPPATPVIAQVKVGLYDDKLAKLAARDASGAELAEPVIGELAIQPSRPREAARPLVTFGDQLALIRSAADRDALSAGATLNLEMRWQALSRMSHTYTLFVHLADDAGRPVAQHDSPPRGGAFPTTLWAPGETVEDDVSLAVNAPPGRYQLLAGAYDSQTQQRLPASTGGDTYRIGWVTVS